MVLRIVRLGKSHRGRPWARNRPLRVSHAAGFQGKGHDFDRIRQQAERTPPGSSTHGQPQKKKSYLEAEDKLIDHIPQADRLLVD